MNQDNEQDTAIAVIQRDIEYLVNETKKCNERMEKLIQDHDERFITKDQFQPIKNFYTKITNFSFGLIVLIGAAAVYAVTALKERFFH